MNLTVRAGEIVGIAGLMGSFRGPLGRTLCGVLAPASGEILLRGRPVRWSGLAHAVRERIAYVPGGPEDRRPLRGPVGDGERRSPRRFTKSRGAASIRGARSEQIARSAIARLGNKGAGPGSPVRALSGGNQQKTLLARWLETDPEILIVDEPTRGVDVAAKHEIHAILARLAEAGAGIIVISSDLIELIALADRIVVMHAGRIAGELDAATASEEAIMSLASGLDGARSGRAA